MDYKIIRSGRRTLSLSVGDDLIPVVRTPYGVSDKTVREFVEKNSAWLERASEKKRAQLERYNISAEEEQRLKALAREYIPGRVEYYSGLMSLEPFAVKLTSAKKRFGSCSAANSLCFSFYLMMYPPEAVDYVVVHELAHIRYHNHSKEFYALVGQYLPDYKQREKLLRS